MDAGVEVHAALDRNGSPGRPSRLDVSATCAAEHLAKPRHARRLRVARDPRDRRARSACGRRCCLLRLPRAFGPAVLIPVLAILAFRHRVALSFRSTVDAASRAVAALARRRLIHGEVRQPVGVLVELAPDMFVIHAADSIGEQSCLSEERLQALVLDLVDAPHLLDEQERVRAHLQSVAPFVADHSSAASRPWYSATLFVACGRATQQFGDDHAVGVLDDGAPSGRAGVAARASVNIHGESRHGRFFGRQRRSGLRSGRSRVGRRPCPARSRGCAGSCRIARWHRCGAPAASRPAAGGHGRPCRLPGPSARRPATGEV